MAMTGLPSPNFQFSLGSIFKIFSVTAPIIAAMGWLLNTAVAGGSYRTSVEDRLVNTDVNLSRLASAIVSSQSDISQLAKTIQEAQREMAALVEKVSSTDKSLGRIEDKLDGVPAANARARGGN